MTHDIDKPIADAAALTAPVFAAAGWTWGGPGRSFVPGQAHVALLLRRLVESAEREKSDWVRSGRLMVTRDEEMQEVGLFLEVGTVPWPG